MPPKLTPMPQPEFEDETTLYSLASEYLEVATVLLDTPSTRMGYTLVTYYLAGHAAELVLKSFLFKHGDTIEVLTKRYGHNLKRLVKRARERGLSATVLTEHIENFGNIYTKKHTEYRQKKPLRFPPLNLLLLEIRKLQSHVFNHVVEFA